MKSFVVLLCTALTAITGCTKNPATGETQLSIISREQEIEIGEQGAREVEETIGLVEDKALQRYVAQVGIQLAARSETPGWPWVFAVVDDPTVNAFALPGGKVFATRGLIEHLTNEAQLASVLGHETGHVTARHSAEQLSKAQLAELGLGISAVVIGDARELLPLAAAGVSLLFLKFGRDDEYQADELGVRYASRAGYDVREMPAVFRMLDRVSHAEGDGGRLPEWLATHPSPEHRIDRFEKQIDAVQPEPGGKRERDAYLRRVDGLVYGQDPRDGFFRGDHFYHPKLRFTLALPQAWQRVNYRQAVVAATPDGDAVAQLTLSTKGEPERALDAFAAREGVDIGAPADLVPELPSASARFSVRSQQTPLEGLVTYAVLNERTFEIITLSPRERFESNAEVFRRIHGSLEALTDPKLLAVKPARVELLPVRESTRLADLYAGRPSGASLERIALLNQMERDTRLAPGQIVKWVSPGSAPAAGER